jgi:hypothetical protein
MELMFANSGKGAVVCRDNFGGGEATSDKRYFSEVLTREEILVIHIVIILTIIIIDHDSTLT